MFLFLFITNFTDAQNTADSVLRNWLTSYRVDNNHPETGTLYFWKHPDTLASCIKNNTILNSSWGEDCDYDLAWFKYADALFDEKPASHFLAAWLQEDRFFNRLQAAWPCYWQEIDRKLDTVKSPNNCYADQLVKAELRDSALLIVYQPNEKTKFYVIDLSGQTLEEDEIKKRKKHIAAVFYCEHKKGRFRYCTGYISDKNPCTNRRKFWHGKTTRYNYWVRSYFLINESMIEKWSSGTSEIKKMIDTDLEKLKELFIYTENHPYQDWYSDKQEIADTWHKDTSTLSMGQLTFGLMRKSKELGSSGLKNCIPILNYYKNLQTNPVIVFPLKE